MSEAPMALSGRRALLVWHSRSEGSSPGSDAYLLDPPAPPSMAAGLFLVAPKTLETFPTLLQEAESPPPEEWLRFLSCCRLVDGELRSRGRVLEVWRQRDALPALREAAREDPVEVIRPGTGPALLPVPGGRVPLNEPFLAAIRDNREYLGLAGEGVGRGAIWIWGVPKEHHLGIVLLLHQAGPRWSALVNPFRIPAGTLKAG